MRKNYHDIYFSESYWEKVKQNVEDAKRPKRNTKKHKIEYQLEESLKRNDFTKDRDRILYSKSFRRLEHKAQIFSHEKGDHFRTRLTHTIEVNQIARSLCRNLSLNEDLVEAIALGHDIGHTPFGHQGERTLNEIMSGVDDLGEKIFFPLYHGGFKHNFHGIKILDYIEKIYDHDNGLFLTWQTIEGILKHTKTLTEDGRLLCNIGYFCKHPDFYFVDKGANLVQYKHSVTLEGQIVALADDIAQRQHDLSDSLSDARLNITIVNIIDLIVQCIDASSTHNSDAKTTDMAKTFKKNILAIKKKKLQTNHLVSSIIQYFLIDATYQSMENIILFNDDTDSKFRFMGADNCFNHQIISLSNTAKKVNESIGDYISNSIVNSYDVNRFDARSNYIIRQLFKAYYSNPKQMSNRALTNLQLLLTNLADDISKLRLSCVSDLKLIIELLHTNIRMGSKKQIALLIKFIRIEIDDHFSFSKELRTKLHYSQIGECRDEDLVVYCVSNPDNINNRMSQFQYDLWRINNQLQNEILGLVPLTDSDDVYEMLCQILVSANYYFLSTICDYIAGMTDNFAKGEYRNLYSIYNE